MRIDLKKNSLGILQKTFLKTNRNVFSQTHILTNSFADSLLVGSLNVVGVRQTEDLNRPYQRMVNHTKQTPGKLVLTPQKPSGV